MDYGKYGKDGKDALNRTSELAAALRGARRDLSEARAEWLGSVVTALRDDAANQANLAKASGMRQSQLGVLVSTDGELTSAGVRAIAEGS